MKAYIEDMHRNRIGEVDEITLCIDYISEDETVMIREYLTSGSLLELVPVG